MKFICSLIVVEDIDRSKKFYCDVLGQKITADYGENVVFGVFAIHQKNHFRQLIGNPDITMKSHSHELYFEDDDLESIEKRLSILNISFLHGIVKQPWGQDVIRFYDLDGNLVEVGRTMPGT